MQHEDYMFVVRYYLDLVLCGYPPHSREADDYALQLVESGALDLELLITHHLPMTQYRMGIDLLEKQDAIKVSFNPWQDS